MRLLFVTRIFTFIHKINKSIYGINIKTKTWHTIKCYNTCFKHYLQINYSSRFCYDKARLT